LRRALHDYGATAVRAVTGRLDEFAYAILSEHHPPDQNGTPAVERFATASLNGTPVPA